MPASRKNAAASPTNSSLNWRARLRALLAKAERGHLVYLEGIVSKLATSRYRSGRTKSWLREA
jgi:ATP-dependent DNA ligase